MLEGLLIIINVTVQPVVITDSTTGLAGGIGDEVCRPSTNEKDNSPGLDHVIRDWCFWPHSMERCCPPAGSVGERVRCASGARDGETTGGRGGRFSSGLGFEMSPERWNGKRLSSNGESPW
ncbi:uncharacterized protein LOC135166892 isoform X1 [Diachasmimorpha longicaudata]|uniref:uncharacterized protein LOC135166892 isoform X1 n=1 Tax=Diachasmimorpha longicaudata TaxID=58733 RepID=UPI0030B88E56